MSLMYYKSLIKSLITLDHHQPSLSGDRNTKRNGVTLESQLQLRVNFQLGEKLTEGIIEQLDSCALGSLLFLLRKLFASLRHSSSLVRVSFLLLIFPFFFILYLFHEDNIFVPIDSNFGSFTFSFLFNTCFIQLICLCLLNNS